MLCILTAIVFSSLVFRPCPQVGVHYKNQAKQVVEIGAGVLSVKQCTHILLHILGRYHEHQRQDREHYVQVIWKNIQEGDFKHKSLQQI